MEAIKTQQLIQDTSTDFRVCAKIYTDTEIFEKEMEFIFEKSWIYIAHESELQHPGDYKTGRIGRVPIIISRSENEGIHVLLNACRHRGNAVCREERGNSNFFRCPYHGWVYKNSGELVFISQRAGYADDFGDDISGLVKVPRVAQYRGLVFASLSPDGESLESYLGAVKKYVDLWADASPSGKLRVHRPHKVLYAGNWKFQAENGADGYHAKFVHESAFRSREFFGGARTSESSSARDVGATRGFDQGHCLLERPGLRVEMKPELRDGLLQVHNRERVEEILNIRHILIFPNVYLMDANIRVIQPVDVDHTEVYSSFVELEGVSENINQDRFRNLQERLGTAGFISPDDMEMFSSNQTGMCALGRQYIVLSRGVHREKVLADGEREGSPSDETSQRAIYRGWARLMNGQLG